ncbi:MAG: CDP-diacylglycerol--glycerol-3-phosphate 3-phosphatidyltransferase [Lachnospiraceae bacterium]|nr:CDP-diacylglycerol--glycerol-3-phosphate 3-phosphatidyltransferase [Lachnospiraceae bacterium]
MNLPNKLTLLRMVLAVFFVVFLLLSDTYEYLKWIALAIFIVASLTDMLDGKIARKYNLVTNFGKFMDPLADKLLVCSALIGLTDLGMVPAWMTIVIIAREFIISGFRLVAAQQGIVIAAGYWGKIKTVCQMIMICVMLVVVNIHGFEGELEGVFDGLTMVGNVLLWISVVLTIVSLIDYLVKNKGVIKVE